MAGKLGSLWVSLGLNTAEFNKDLGKASKKVRRVGRGMRRSFMKVDRAIFRTTKIVAGLAGPAALGLLVKNSFDTVDALAKTADKLGLTTEALAGMRHAAEQTGIAQNTLDMALQRMTRRVAEAGQGFGEAKAAIAELGLDAQKLSKQTPDEVFRQLAGAMEGVTNKGDKLRLAFKLFDSEGAALVNTLALGTKGLEEMQVEAEALGLAVSRVNASKIEEASNAFNRMKGVVKGIGNTIAVKLAPLLKDVADRFTKAAIESGGFKDEISKGVKIAVKGLGMVADALRIMEIGWKTVNVVFQGFIAGSATAMEGLLHGINKVTDALGMERKTDPDFLVIAKATRSVLAESTEELAKLTSQPMPSDNIQQWAIEAEAAAQKVGEAMTTAMTGGGQEQAKKLTEAQAANLAKQVEALRQSTLEQSEILQLKHDEDLARLQMAEENKIATLIPYQELREKLEEQHQKKLGKLRKDQAEKDKKIMISNMTDGMQIVGHLLASAAALNESRNKKEFEKSKKLQIASIIINTASAAMKAYNSAGNPYLGAALAAVVVAAGAVQLNRVQGTSYQGGGNVGSAPTAPASSGGGQPDSQPLADTGTADTTAQTANVRSSQKIIVNLDSKPILEAVEEGTSNGTITIDANAVRTA